MGLISKNGDTLLNRTETVPPTQPPTVAEMVATAKRLSEAEIAPPVKQVSERERSIILQCGMKIAGPAMVHWAGNPAEWFDMTVKMGRALAEEIMK